MASKMGTTTRKKRTSRSALQQLMGEFISLPNRPLRFSVEVRIIGFPAPAPIREHAAQGKTMIDELSSGASGTRPAACFADLCVLILNTCQAGMRAKEMEDRSRISL